jgi:hypothetical protein
MNAAKVPDKLPAPRLKYSCPNPKCKDLIVRVYTAAQLGTRLPAVVHRGLQHGGEMTSGSGTMGVFSANVKRLRAKDFHVSFIDPSIDPALITPNDIAVACEGCRDKFSVPITPILEDLRSGKRHGVLRTRRTSERRG